MKKTNLSKPEPKPKNRGKSIVSMVIKDLEDRREFGRKKYGDELRVWNGRKPLVDAYQEALDLVIYLRQALARKSGRKDKAETVPVNHPGEFYFVFNGLFWRGFLTEGEVTVSQEYARCCISIEGIEVDKARCSNDVLVLGTCPRQVCVYQNKTFLDDILLEGGRK